MGDQRLPKPSVMVKPPLEYDSKNVKMVGSRVVAWPSSHVPIDDGPHHAPRTVREITMLPSCAVCSGEYAKRTRMPARCLVESAIVIRDTASGRYRAIVRCHGESEVLDLGEEAEDRHIRNAYAFTKGR